MTPHAQLSDTEFRQIQRIVYEAAGLAIAENGRVLLSSRVRKRLKIVGIQREHFWRLAFSIRDRLEPIEFALGG